MDAIHELMVNIKVGGRQSHLWASFPGPHNLRYHHPAVTVADANRNSPKTLKGPYMPLPITLRAFPAQRP